MKFHRRRNRLRRTLALALGLLALAAPSASAVTAEQFLGPDGTTKSTQHQNRIGSPSTGNGVDYAPSKPISYNPPVTTTIDNGFDWTSAGIGAAIAAGLILMSLVAMGGVSRFRARPAR